MGLFDFFRKKDGAFYLERARKTLAERHFAHARDDAEDGLSLSGCPEETRKALLAVKHEAMEALYSLNLEQAERCLSSRDFARTADHLEIARHNRTEQVDGKRLEALQKQLEEARATAQKKVEVVMPDPDEEEDDETFQVYLGSLAPDVAAVYSRLGRRFAAAYVAMNEGRVDQALALFSRVEVSSDAEKGLLAFEQGRALLALGQPADALMMLEVARKLRGGRPIFITDHPSIAYLRFEAQAMLGRLEEATDALREGLKSNPSNSELRQNLASVLIHRKGFDEAEALLSEELACSRSNPQVYVLRARLQTEKGSPRAAIETLELGLKSCGCSPAALPHPILARSLADLYLDEQLNQERVEKLVSQLFRAQQGEVEWFDYYLQARLLKWKGDEGTARASCKKALSMMDDPRDPRRALVEGLFA